MLQCGPLSWGDGLPHALCGPLSWSHCGVQLRHTPRYVLAPPTQGAINNLFRLCAMQKVAGSARSKKRQLGADDTKEGWGT